MIVHVRTAAVLPAFLTAASLACAQPKSESKPPSILDRPFLQLDYDAPPAETEQALKAHTRTAAQELRKGNLEGAHAELVKAWRLKQLASIAASLATIEMKLGRYRDAAERWDYVLENLPAERTEDRATAEADLAECRKHVGSIRVAVDTPGALILVDDRAIGAAPLARNVWLDPGEHVVFARSNNRTSNRVAVNLSAGETKSVVLELNAPPIAPPTVTPAASEPPPPAPVRDQRTDAGIQPRTFFLIGGAVLTIAAGTIGVVYTAQANDAEDETVRLQDLIGQKSDQSPRCGPRATTPPAECDQLAAELREHDRTRNIATAAFVTAGALGAATVSALLFWPDAKPANRARLTISPWQLSLARGVVVRTTF